MEITQKQKYEILQHEIQKGVGLDQIVKLGLEILMKSEREEHNLQNGDYSNGYRYRKMFGSGKLLELKVPRTRDGGFHSIILTLLKDQEEEARELAFCLYGSGLTTLEVSNIFGRLYGKNYSSSQVSRMFEYARKDIEEWKRRPLESYYPIIYIDATFISTRRGESCSKEAYYTMLGVKADMTREVIAVINNPTESASFWEDILEEQKKRGIREVGLFVSDGLIGIENALWKSFPNANVQLCTVHFQRECAKCVRAKDRTLFCSELSAVFQSEEGDKPIDGLNKWKHFYEKWKHTYPFLKKKNNDRIALYFTYMNYDVRIRNMIYSTNWIERLNKMYKRVTKMRGALPNTDAVLLLLCNVAMNVKAYDFPVTSFRFESEKFKWDIN